MGVGTVALLLCADIIALRFSLASADVLIRPQFECTASNLSVRERARVCVLLFIIFNEAPLIMQPGLCHWSPGVD